MTRVEEMTADKIISRVLSGFSLRASISNFLTYEAFVIDNI